MPHIAHLGHVPNSIENISGLFDNFLSHPTGLTHGLNLVSGLKRRMRSSMDVAIQCVPQETHQSS